MEGINYIPNSVVIRSILKKNTGNVSILSSDSEETFIEKTIPFDALVQIVDGSAEIRIHGISFMVDAGESIIIPANAPNTIRSKVRFKMITTVIQGSYMA